MRARACTGCLRRFSGAYEDNITVVMVIIVLVLVTCHTPTASSRYTSTTAP